ncbi:zinc finger protein 438 isoform X5 [Oryctolagus cuniculus]|uniref:zinc finger protein 438 isoform X5 n=2 Tax=Oryctolagus cuniculus TaxID=9986 RepID=UPI003879F692
MSSHQRAFSMSGSFNIIPFIVITVMIGFMSAILPFVFCRYHASSVLPFLPSLEIKFIKKIHPVPYDSAGTLGKRYVCLPEILMEITHNPHARLAKYFRISCWEQPRIWKASSENQLTGKDLLKKTWEVPVEVQYDRMQNPPLVPPKEQGESSTPSGPAHSGKGWKSKRQFRTIAPKIVPRVLPPRVLPCQPPALSDQAGQGPAGTARPLGLPAQNYALMQVAGQEGTFSLVALPHVAAAQPVQKARLPGNLKLPIPRYQSPGSNKGCSRRPLPSSPEGAWGKTQTCPQRSPSPPAQNPELPHQPSPPEQAASPHQAPAGSIGAATPTNRGSRSHSRPPGTSKHPGTLALSSPAGPTAEQGLSKTPRKTNFASRKASAKAPAVTSDKHKAPGDLAKAVASPAPAVLGSAVQWISVPRGKLPISRARTAEVFKLASEASPAECPFPRPGASCEQPASIPEGSGAAAQMAVSKTPGPQASRLSPCERAFCPATKPDVSHKTRPNGRAAKGRAKKRKAPDDVLAFQGKRRKGLVSKCRDAKERVKHTPQESRDQKPGAVKKYRSIMPKPVLAVPTLAPLAASVALVPSQTPSGPGQDLCPLAKRLGCKQDRGPSPKPGPGLRNGFCGLKKPWHRCHVCSRHFQFKQHLRDHMSTHPDTRPYSCRVCRKAYVRAGSLSTHMKLQHAESRPKKLVCCEFCAKVFGHVRVYLGHLKEVHRVVISTEPAPSEPQPGTAAKSRARDAGVRGRAASPDREGKSSLEEDFLLNQAEEVRLQIKCGRCQVTAQSFADIKFHLLYVHGEEIQGRLQEGLVAGGKGAAEEPAKQQATPDWTLGPQRTQLAGEDLRACPKLNGQLYPHHPLGAETLVGKEGTQEPEADPRGPEGAGPHSVVLWSRAGFHCVLCTQTLGRREELLVHWARQHNCQDPARLWAILQASAQQGVMQLSSDAARCSAPELPAP